EDDFLVIGFEAAREFARIPNIIRLAFKTLVFLAETDSERFERLRAKALCHRQQTTGIHSTAQKQTNRHVADHLASDGFEEQVAQSGRQGCFVRRRMGVAKNQFVEARGGGFFDDERHHVSGWDLAYLLE